MSAHALEWWSSLRHGGLLLTPSRLTEHFDTKLAPLSAYETENLRRALLRLDDASADDRAGFVRAVLEDLCKLDEAHGVRWLAGSALDAATWSRKALTGETVRPRRVLQGPHGETLPLFVVDGDRLGVGHGLRALSRTIEWLRRSDQRLAVVTNLRQWRLVYAGADYDAWAEWDTALWFEGGEVSRQVEALRHLLAPGAILAPSRSERAPLLAAIEASRRGQAELSSTLGERVRQAVELLIQSHGEALAGAAPKHDPREVYLAATRVVMRMVVILFAEARDLLPRNNPIYHGSYGLQGLREQLDAADARRLRGHHGAWGRVLGLFRLVHDGSHHEALPIPRYGGGLFRPADTLPADDGVARALAVFEDPAHDLTDETVARVLEYLCRTRVKVRQGRASVWMPAPVDFSDLSSEYIGILYEGLLDFELRRAEAGDPMVFLALGDEPVLPLSRLEAMPDAALKGLLDRFKKPSKSDAEGDAGEDAGEAPEAADGDALPAGEDEPADEPTDEPADEAPEADGGADEAAADDPREVARKRAEAWARKAVVTGAKVAKPRARKAEDKDAYERAVASEARRLVRRTILPGEWFLVRWGGTRKGSGTFYTPPQLAVPTVHRTLLALTHTPPLRPDGSEDADAPRARWTPKTPAEILALRVCDPAMGSGSFLVAALRFLTDALFESLHVHGAIHPQGPDATVVTLPLGHADDARLPNELLPCRPTDERFEPLLRARLKRYVVTRCLYGIDLDPLAVELARLALWVETMDRELPFEFLDHHLKRGNALVGCWFDRFEDYPVLAWERDGGDAKHDNGVHFKKGERTAKIKSFRNATVIPALRDWLSGQRRLSFEAQVGETPAAVHEQLRAVMETIAEIPLTRPDERETRYLQKVRLNPGYLKLREAFDTWCALWFWPVDALDLAPLPGGHLSLTSEATEVVRALTRRHGFFHWELEFPEVFTGEASGFDAVVGNPPWENLQPNPAEFFSNHDPLFRAYNQSQVLEVITLCFAEDRTEREWLGYCGQFRDLANYFNLAASRLEDGKPVERKERWPFRLQGTGRVFTYKLFIECSLTLMKPSGSIGVLVPSALYSDKGATLLRKQFLQHMHWELLYAFQNERFVFGGIHHSFKIALIIARGIGRREAVRARFRIGPGDSPELREVTEDVLTAHGTMEITEAQTRRFSPESWAITEIRSLRDFGILQRIYESAQSLGASKIAPWRVHGRIEFMMNKSAPEYFQKTELETRHGYRFDDLVTWRSADIQEAYAICQGVMIGQYDPSATRWVSGTGLRAVWNEIPWREKALAPQCLIRREIALKRCGFHHGIKFAVRRVARSTDTRTLIGAVVRSVVCVDKLAVFESDHAPLLAAVVNSLALDWTARNRVGGTQIDFHVLNELPLPVDISTANDVERLVIRLNCAALFFADEWLRWRSRLAPERAWRSLWAVTPHERLRLRCMLDAIVTALYGLDADDLRWILRDCDHPTEVVCDKRRARTFDPKGFWRVDKERAPELRHTVLTQVAFADLTRAIGDANGDRDAGIAAFCAQNEGEGWMLPEALRLADYGLGHDARAKEPQPVASVLGARFEAWQLAQSAEASWAECERHARNLLGEEGYARLQRELAEERAKPEEAQPEGATTTPGATEPRAEKPVARDLFGEVIPEKKPRGKKRSSRSS